MEINKIHNIDCLDGLRKLETKSIDLIITSPPYNVGKNNMSYRAKHKYKDDKDIKEDYYDWLSCRLNEMIRCSKYVFLNIQMLANNKIDFLNIIANYKEYLKEIIIWGKTNPPPAMEPGVMNSCFEFILIFSDERPEKRKFYGLDFRGTVKNMISTPVNRNRFSNVHKAVFPIEIPRYIINAFTKVGNTVCDPFMGVGTTAVACNELNRNFVGFEINEEYCNVANERLKQTRLTNAGKEDDM